MAGRVKDMIEEFLHSDVIYPGGRIMRIDECQKAYPKSSAIWNTYVRENISEEYIFVLDYEYGVSATVNAFYSIDFDKAVAAYICSFDENSRKENLYHSPIRIENKLIFAPGKSHRWAIYYPETNTWMYEGIPSEFLPREGKMFVKNWALVKDCLVYMPGDKKVIVKLDCRNGEITYHDCLRKFIEAEGDISEFSSMAVNNGSVLFFTKEDNSVYELDVSSMTLIKVHKINTVCKGIQSSFALPKTDWIYLIKTRIPEEKDWEESVIKWNVKTEEIIEIWDLPINPCEDASENLISGFCYDKGELYAVPFQGDSFLKIKHQTGEVKRIEIRIEHGLFERKDDYYRRWGDRSAFPMLLYNGKEAAFTATLPYDFSLAEIDFENGRLYNNRKWYVSGSEKLLRISQTQQFDGGFVENQYFSLKEFIEELAEN